MTLRRVLFTIVMFVVNYLAVSLPINSITTSTLSDNLSTLITPAGFTFGVWSLIYLGITIVTLLVVLKKIIVPRKIMIRYSISALANALWIVARHYQNLHLSMILMLVILISLIIINTSLKKSPSLFHSFIFRNSFLLYLGRIQIASFVMFTIYLIYQLGIIDNQTVWWPAIVIVIVGISNIIILYKERNITTSLVALWALWGIIATQSNGTISLLSYIVGGVIIIGSIIVGIGHYGKKALSHNSTLDT